MEVHDPCPRRAGVLRANGPSPSEVAGSTAAFAKLPEPVAAIRRMEVHSWIRPLLANHDDFVDGTAKGSSLVAVLRTEPIRQAMGGRTGIQGTRSIQEDA